MVFSVGETVVYPHHGAALIEAIETRVVRGEEKLYLVLRVAQGDLTVRVPAENAEIVGVREVVGEEGLTKVFDVLRVGGDTCCSQSDMSDWQAICECSALLIRYTAGSTIPVKREKEDSHVF